MIYVKFVKPLNISLEFSIFSKLKLEISKANNSWHSENIFSILVTNDESKWLKSIDIIFLALLSMLASKNFSRLVTLFLKHNLTLLFSFISNFSFIGYIILSLKIKET